MSSSKKNKTSLSSLARRLISASFLALIGARGLVVPRLNLLANYKTDPQLTHIWFYIDLGSLTFSIFGLFAMFYYYRKLRCRFKRIEALGEHEW